MAAMRRLLMAAISLGFVAACLAGPAHAQGKKGAEPTPMQQDEIQKKKDAETVDAQYRKALKQTEGNTPDVRLDPWSNMRGTDDAKVKR
jgi:hypothetical protein